MKRFAIVVPITIAGIFLLLFSSFNSMKEAVLIILNIPFAMIGGAIQLHRAAVSSAADWLHRESPPSWRKI